MRGVPGGLPPCGSRPGTAAPLTTAFLVGVAAACAVGEVTWPEDEEGPGLSRDALEVTVLVAPEDSAAAAALGWPGRRVPGGRVRLLPESAAGGIALDDSLTAETDSAGVARFTGLLPARLYRVSALRRLADDEVAAVADRRPHLRAFAGGDKARAGAPYELSLQPNRAHSVVFSEVARVTPLPGEPGDGYRFNGYVELYNHSDRTVFLDGMVIGLAFSFDLNYTARPCAETRPFQADPEGIWARWFEAFPGSGTDHPVRPGEIVVVSTDAVDHGQVAPAFPDLTGADFEFHGPADVDNPEVPNMVDVGLESSFGGHGLRRFRHFEIALFVSEPVDLDQLPRARPDPANDRVYVRFPAEKVLDATFSITASSFRGIRLCRDLVHDRFDRLAHEWKRRTPDGRFVHTRRPAGRAADGRPLLLDTNTSSVDFSWAEQSPGRISTQ